MHAAVLLRYTRRPLNWSGCVVGHLPRDCARHTEPLVTLDRNVPPQRRVDDTPIEILVSGSAIAKIYPYVSDSKGYSEFENPIGIDGHVQDHADYVHAYASNSSLPGKVGREIATHDRDAGSLPYLPYWPSPAAFHRESPLDFAAASPHRRPESFLVRNSTSQWHQSSKACRAIAKPESWCVEMWGKRQLLNTGTCST